MRIAAEEAAVQIDELVRYSCVCPGSGHVAWLQIRVDNAFVVQALKRFSKLLGHVSHTFDLAAGPALPLEAVEQRAVLLRQHEEDAVSLGPTPVWPAAVQPKVEHWYDSSFRSACLRNHRNSSRIRRD